MKIFATVEKSKDLQKAVLARDLSPEKIFLQTKAPLRKLLRSQGVKWIECPDHSLLYARARDAVDALYSHYSSETREREEILIQAGGGELKDLRLGKIIWQDGDVDDFPIVSKTGSILPEVFLALQALEKDLVIASKKDLELSVRVQTIVHHLEKPGPKWLHL